ncbi:MAG: nucleotidyl transferase AbiEii/AbiGii toxin family protein [Candidatus Moraniibacteriota bacterium]|nr:MAG: nucleotidyl transferase AbiEii/AbiGii toxin family protein [Candidatus Moranbacteria bacterium]
MDKVARLSSTERQELFSEAAARKGVTPAIIEKDFWVTWVLSKLFANDELARLLMFKGGTSLSKVFRLIERFSEDIDLILDWNVLTSEEPLEDRSRRKQETLNNTINEQAKTYIAQILHPLIASQIEPVCRCVLDVDDGFVLNIHYPAAFPDLYLRPEVRLEIGPLAAWFPSGTFEISSYAAAEFPQVFAQSSCRVKAILAERTFWEKATILHHEANRPTDSVQPPRYSRHYFDLARMAMSWVRGSALSRLDLLADVIAFKQRFYPRGWAQYDRAVAGTLKLVPPPHVLSVIRQDYQNMQQMIFGHSLTFEEMMATLNDLEKEINALSNQS